ncbi:hypothetical protein [Kineococcus esterisolvens]|uniref:hypothetical protein n=1 Tax=unclassified Kineococcus TaxID=2621656 RepID=UPI003D7D7533
MLLRHGDDGACRVQRPAGARVSKGRSGARLIPSGEAAVDSPHPRLVRTENPGDSDKQVGAGGPRSGVDAWAPQPAGRPTTTASGTGRHPR